MGRHRFSALTLVIALVAIAAPATAAPPSVRLSPFPLGWYDAVHYPERLGEFAQEGVDMVVPYNLRGLDPAPYLDKALVSGVSVMLMIERGWVVKADLKRVRSFVAQFKSHPALYGWHLADEPTIGRQRISPASARKVYKTIRSVDPDHPIGIVFGKIENVRPFVGAMDVLMYDDYPSVAKRPEFSALPKWWERMKDRAAVGRRVGGYVAVLQGFGQDNHGEPQFQKRLPTAAETRYMAYASIVAGATGIAYWARYRSRSEWVRSVLTPVLTELRQLRPAFERGAVRGVRVAASSVTASLFKDPGDGSLVLIAVHHGPNKVVAGLSVGSAASGGRAFEVRNGSVRLADPAKDVFGPYQVRVYRLL